MGIQFDLVAFSTTTTGTGTLTVSSALTGCRTPAGASIPDGTSVSYAINSASGAQLETGIGVIGGSGTTMTRSLRASTTGSLLNLSGTSDVYLTCIAEDFPVTEVPNWAALQALTGVPDGRRVTVMAPVIPGGTRGTQWVRDGSVWRPAGPQAIYILRTPIAGTTGGASSQSLLALEVPGGLFTASGRVTLKAKLNYSASDSSFRNIRLFIGSSSSSFPGNGTEFLIIANLASNVRQVSFGRAFQTTSNTFLKYSDANASNVANEYSLTTSTGTTQGNDFAQADMSGTTFLHVVSYQSAGFSATVTLDQFTLLVE